MRKKQEHFTPSDDQLVSDILEIANKERRSKSEMIDILLHQAVKERNRKKLAKEKIHTTSNTADMVPSNPK